MKKMKTLVFAGKSFEFLEITWSTHSLFHKIIEGRIEDSLLWQNLLKNFKIELPIHIKLRFLCTFASNSTFNLMGI